MSHGQRRHLAPFVPVLAWALISCGGTSRDEEGIRSALLISIDTCRADHLGAYGHEGEITPNIDALARRGVLFERAYSPSPMTLPAHASMMTGMLPPAHGVRTNIDYRLGASEVTLAEVLQENGFATAAFVSSAIMGTQFGLHQGFEFYDDPVKQGGGPLPSLERSCEETSDLLLEWLKERGDEPFFLFLHLFDPHYPYAPPKPLAPGYESEIAYVDRCLGELFEEMRRIDHLDSTLIAITSDHGEMLGEHGENTHGYTIYESAIRVPLILVPPGKSKGRRIAEPVGLVDLPRTICGALGVEPPPGAGGEDLSRYLDGGETRGVSRLFYSESVTPVEYEANPWFGLSGEQWKMIETTRPELYDLSSDPGEVDDLAKAEPDRIEELRSRLKEVLAENRREGPSEAGPALDEERRRQLEALGYVSGGRPREELSIEPGRADPKDLVDFHRAHATLMGLQKQRSFEAARELGEKMLEERPDSVKVHLTVANIAIEQKDLQAAVSHLRRAIELDPCFARVQVRLGIVLRSQRDLAGAMTHFRKAVECEPDYPEAHGLLGLGLVAQGRPNDAAIHFRRVLELNPGDVPANLHLGALLAAQGKTQEAIEHYEEALRLDPENARGHYLLGLALQAGGGSREALGHYRQASLSNPGWPLPLIAAAWILASDRDDDVRRPDVAIVMATRTCELTGERDPRALDVLAAAYAAAGRYGEATAKAEAALELFGPSQGGRLVAGIRERLALYREGQPYLERELEGP